MRYKRDSRDVRETRDWLEVASRSEFTNRPEQRPLFYENHDHEKKSDWSLCADARPPRGLRFLRAPQADSRKRPCAD